MERLKKLFEDIVVQCETYEEAINRFRSLRSEKVISDKEYGMIIDNYSKWLDEIGL